LIRHNFAVTFSTEGFLNCISSLCIEIKARIISGNKCYYTIH
jgi:hypothetical protein